MRFDGMDESLLQAAQDRDMENARVFWRETSEANKARLWTRIQRTESDPLNECVVRMAQLGMTAVALEAIRRDKPPILDIDVLTVNAELLGALKLLMDQVDYTSKACGMMEPISGVLDAAIIKRVKTTIAHVEGGK